MRRCAVCGTIVEWRLARSCGEGKSLQATTAHPCSLFHRRTLLSISSIRPSGQPTRHLCPRRAIHVQQRSTLRISDSKSESRDFSLLGMFLLGIFEPVLISIKTGDLRQM
jgi:hypothetical protein